MGRGKVIIFDEYYSALVDVRLKVNSKGKLNPLLQMGDKKETLILMSGHNSQEFNAFLRSLYSGKVDIQINSSIPELFGLPKQQYLPSLMLCTDETTVQSEAI